jgi:PLP dependent protein
VTRREELAAGLSQVRTRIDRAAVAAARRPDEITLIAVTKTFPPSDVAILADLGVRDIGENRDQEAAAKAAACGGLPVHWHFVGQLQTNKVRSVASYASVVQSVDRMRLVRALDRAAQQVDRRLSCLVQVDLDAGAEDADPERGGARPEEVSALADEIARREALDLGGVMAIAPLGEDPVAAFARLAEVAGRLRADHPEATVISAGMSGDLEQAIAAGATHVRVGTALLGTRPLLG